MIKHPEWINYLTEFANKKGMKVLEIGSRIVTSEAVNFRKSFNNSEYVGFDFYKGENVDVVGDAHKLSTYFHETEKFDLIFSSAVFEHFAMPWIVSLEISKMLKIGGIVFIETHYSYSYSSHESPWHFFQFSDIALRVLFSPSLGFECIEAEVSNPIIGRFSNTAFEPLRNLPVTGLYCHSEYLGKKVKDVTNFEWEKLSLDEIVGGTVYPNG
ncbi:hypothetical protein FACS189494_05520 [Spirochaetia bacterium]|nr:hypothetical protein FACS189494_05520 [Spirochaetia bacterium]